MFGMSKPLLFGIGALVLIVAILGYFQLRGDEQERHENQLVNSGVIQERGAALEGAINRAEAAEDARDNPSSNELRVVCEKYDRNCTPSNQ